MGETLWRGGRGESSLVSFCVRQLSLTYEWHELQAKVVQAMADFGDKLAPSTLSPDSPNKSSWVAVFVH